jgi:hypothetical protein
LFVLFWEVCTHRDRQTGMLGSEALWVFSLTRAKNMLQGRRAALLF